MFDQRYGMQPETYYHIYNHANGSENLYRSAENYRYFLQQWSKYVEPIASTYCYCLMPNHFHFLIRIRSEKEIARKLSTKYKDLTGFINLSGLISQKFSNLFNSYTKACNKMYERRGSLFNRPFQSKEITSEEYLTSIIHYIHHNPIHHGFCKQYEDRPHSSYHALISSLPTQLQREETLDWFGGIKAFEVFHKKNIRYPEEIILNQKTS